MELQFTWVILSPQMGNLTWLSDGHKIDASTKMTDQNQKVQECFLSIKNDEHQNTTEQFVRHKI